MNNTILYIATVLVWGSTWLLINFQLGVVAPEVSVVYRYALAATVLFGWSAWSGLALRFNLFAHLRFFMLGLLLFSFNYIATYSAQQYIPSALNAVVFSTMVWMNVLNARLFFGTRIEPRMYLGASLGMLGLGVLFWPSLVDISLSEKVLLGAGLSVSGALLASLGNMVSSSSQRQGLPIIQSNAWGMFYGTLITAAVAWRRDLPFNFDFSMEYISSLIYLALFGSVLAFGSYLKLLGRIGPGKAGYAMVMFPVVAVLLSVVFEDLALEPHLVAGMVLVLAGNLAILGLRRLIEAGVAFRRWWRTVWAKLTQTKQLVIYAGNTTTDRGCANGQAVSGLNRTF